MDGQAIGESLSIVCVYRVQEYSQTLLWKLLGSQWSFFAEDGSYNEKRYLADGLIPLEKLLLP